MSTMTLKLPNYYVDIDRDEMEYVDGGISFYLNANRSATIATYVYAGGFGITGATAIASLSSKLGAAWAALKRVFSIAAGLIGGVAGQLIVGAVCTLAANNMISFLVNTVTADRKNTGVNMSWYGVGFYNAKYY